MPGTDEIRSLLHDLAGEISAVAAYAELTASNLSSSSPNLDAAIADLDLIRKASTRSLDMVKRLRAAALEG